MPVFTFSGKTNSGEKIQGERNAPNKESLASALRRERITPGSIREKGKEFAMPTFGSSKVKTKDIAVFFRQFSVMIDAGLPLVQCLEILAANQENPNFQKTLTGVRTTVEGGATLANAMRLYPKVFDDLTTNMNEAGQEGPARTLLFRRRIAEVARHWHPASQDRRRSLHAHPRHPDYFWRPDSGRLGDHRPHFRKRGAGRSADESAQGDRGRPYH